jgi:hypothetical protein
MDHRDDPAAPGLAPGPTPGPAAHGDAELPPPRQPEAPVDADDSTSSAGRVAGDDVDDWFDSTDSALGSDEAYGVPLSPKLADRSVFDFE